MTTAPIIKLNDISELFPSRTEQLAAIRTRTPDSIAPDGGMLKHVLRDIRHLSENEKEVIAERRYGWEKADCATLARIFCVHPTTIAKVCEQYRKAAPTSGTAPTTLPADGPAGAHVSHDVRATPSQPQTRHHAPSGHSNTDCSVPNHGEVK